MRLDRYLAQSGERTRSEAARLLRSGTVRVNGEPVRDGGFHLKPDDRVELMGQAVEEKRYQYLMLHKPAGLLTAARDSRAPTVMQLLPESCARRKVLPVGRLDKDTTGLLLFTNDGELAHRLLSPKRHVWKTYEATVTGRLTAADEENILTINTGITSTGMCKSFPAGASSSEKESNAPDARKIPIETSSASLSARFQ